MMENDNRKCRCCQQVYSLSDFAKSKRNKDGLDTFCKTCRNATNKKFRDQNKEKFSSMRKRNYQKNLDKMRKEKRTYAAKTKSRKKAYDKEYRKSNVEKIQTYKRNWELKNKDNPIFKIKRNLRRRVHHVLMGKRKVTKTFDLIGCSAEQFKAHIESLWKENMTWDNYGPKGWHIDHIIPCHRFDLLNEIDQKKCFHFTNQRPLWAWENLTRDYSDIPFQSES